MTSGQRPPGEGRDGTELEESRSQPTLLEVGRVVRPHGVRGAVVVELVTNRLERLEPGSVLETDHGPLEVVRSSPHRGRYLVEFAGIRGRDEAEHLRGAVLRAAPLEDPQELWVHELVGAELVDQRGTPHGRVVALEANPASDLLVLDGGGLVPLRFVVERRAGTIVADLPPGLLS
jgi:16S rRNA processing protein RimM